MKDSAPPSAAPLLWIPLLTGFNTAFASALLLVAPDAALTALRGAPNAGSSLLYLFALTALGALLFALIFQGLHTIVRMGAALLEHTGKIGEYVAPGLAAFLLAGEPALDFALSFLPEAGFVLNAAALVVAFLLSFAVGAVLTALIPGLAGYNSVFLIVAALAARLVFLPQSSAPIWNSAVDSLAYLGGMLFAAFLLFANLQMRYRIQLSPNYERVAITPPLIAAGAALSIGAAMLWMLERLWSAANLPSPAFEGVFFGGENRQLLPGAFFLLMLNQWTLSAIALYRHRLPTLGRQAAMLRRSALFAAGLLAIGLLGLLVVFFHPSPGRALGGIHTGRGIASELISAIGYALDRDADGNSSWPGGDPDDQNPCVRFDMRDRCRIEGEGAGEAAAPAVSRLAAQEPETTASGDLVILSLESEALPLSAQAGLSAERSARYFDLINGSDRTARSLAAHWTGVDGVDERRGIRRTSIFSDLARRGYRTICTLPRREDLERARLDQGCQVTEQRDPRDDASLAAAASHAIELAEAYGERNTVLWLHFGGQTDRGQIAAAMERLSPVGPVLAVAGLAAGRARAEALLYGGRRGFESPPTPVLRDLILSALGQSSAAPRDASEDLGALENEPFTDSWTGRWLRAARTDYPLFPIYTYRMRAGRLTLFDGLTGAEWVERSGPASSP